MFDDSLLEQFMKTFLGYGNLRGRYWFIGMEEGRRRVDDANANFRFVESQLRIWDHSGRKAVLSAPDFHREIGIRDRFFEPVKTQRTWAGPIKIMLAAEGKDGTSEAVAAFQRDDLARDTAKCNNCLLELLPLPACSTRRDSWFYGQFSTIPYLRDRRSYAKAISSLREDLLREMIVKYRPRVVVFYGAKYLKNWTRIAGCGLQPESVDLEDVHVGEGNGTLFVAIPHPAPQRGALPNRFFAGVGALIRSRTAAQN